MADYLKQKNKSVSWKIKMVEITSEEQNKAKRMKITEDSLRELWDNIKLTSIRIMGSQKKKRKRKGMRTFLKRL